MIIVYKRSWPGSSSNSSSRPFWVRWRIVRMQVDCMPQAGPMPCLACLPEGCSVWWIFGAIIEYELTRVARALLIYDSSWMRWPVTVAMLRTDAANKQAA